MNKIVFLIVSVFLGLTLNAQTGEISIKVTGIDVQKGGTINIGVYKSEGFPDVGNQITYKIVEVSEEQTTVLIKDVEPGTYAIAIFQDANTDGELSKNIFGAPTELYGFSRNKYAKGGPPGFNDVSFELEGGKRISLNIDLN